MARTVVCDSPEATGALAGALAALARPGQVVVLAGGLGAGKTTFTKAYAAALGVRAPVTSPSYTLEHHYRCGDDAPVALLVHADLWRLKGEAEVADLALDELLGEGAAAIVEWGDRFEGALPGDHVVVTFRVLGDTSRELTVELGAAGLDGDAYDGLVA